jgi:hypothetical protein
VTKTDFSKINKLLENTVENVKKQLGLDSDEEESSENETEQQPEEEKKSPEKRRIVKAKRTEDTA